MKRTILFLLPALLLLGQLAPCRAQEPGTEIKDREYYAKKSRDQRTAAWFMLGGGAVLSTAGLVIATNNMSFFTEEQNSDYEIGSAMFWVGSASMLGSIPLFIAAAKNKGRSLSASASVSIQKFHPLDRAVLGQSQYPALSIVIRRH